MNALYELVGILAAQAAAHRKIAGVAHTDARHVSAGVLCERLASELPGLHDRSDLATRFGSTPIDHTNVQHYVSAIGFTVFPRNTRELLEALAPDGRAY